MTVSNSVRSPLDTVDPTADADHAAIDPGAVAGEGAEAADRGITGLEYTDEATASGASTSVDGSAPSAEGTGATHLNRTPLNPNEGSSYRPLCSCGWEGGIWQSYDDAVVQIEDHIRHPDGFAASSSEQISG